MIDAPFIILMSGYTATGKTTIANKISKYLTSKEVKHTIIRSDLIRKEMSHKVDCKYFDDNNGENTTKRDVVYAAMRDMAKMSLSKGLSVILDAGHNKRHTRERVYELAKDLNIPLALVNTICEDEVEIKRRLSKRNPKNPLEVANSFEVYKYSKGSADLIEEDAPLIKVNTSNNEIVKSTREEHVQFIVGALK